MTEKPIDPVEHLDRHETELVANLRNVMRSVLLMMDPRTASQLGVIELFVGYEFGEQFQRQCIAPKPS